ncbi:MULTISPECIES: RDD family protein [unclassified Frigoribacterium]|uniref:RDD family protein n=1 Tax=unclassified Frigoribacterium TaxID=2627005 RepID=UPI000F490347|nr:MULTISPECIES: RDD family protein [unclassified Frigoribacterium]NQW86477.1 RDD family protein [Frigoribacterium sp. VKM Ac-2860]NQX07809.1 RDD family protein [Frigoribacterium sp. VKM Ac-2859]
MSRTKARGASPVVLRPDQVEAFTAGGDELVTGEAVALDLRPTSFVLRAAGVLIDYLAYALLLVGALVLVSLLNDGGVLDDALSQAFLVASIAICFIVVPTVVETASHGRSLGRLAVGARIVRTDGGAIGLRHALTRALVGLLEIVFTSGGLAVVVALLNGSSRRLGDLMAGTYSRNERVPKAAHVVYGVPAHLQGWAEIADVGRLPDGLARRIASFLQQAPQLSPASRRRVADELAAETTPFVSPVPSGDPEFLLAGVSALRRRRESAALARESALLDRLTPALTETVRGFPRR